MWRAFYSILSTKLLNFLEKTTQIFLQIYSNLLEKLLKSNEKTTQISQLFLAIEEINPTPARYNNLESDYISIRCRVGEKRISTWIFRNLHVENFYFPRGEEKIPRRNQMKLRRK